MCGWLIFNFFFEDMLGWLVSDFGLYPPVSLYLYIVYINIDDPVGYRGTQRDTGGVKQQFFLSGYTF